MTSNRIYILGGSQTDFARNFAREGCELFDVMRDVASAALASAEDSITPSSAGATRFKRRLLPRRSVRQVRTATPCSHVEYFDRPANFARLRNRRTNTSCAASLASCSFPISRKQIRHTFCR